MDKNKALHISVLEEILGSYSFSSLISWALRFFLRNSYESLVITDHSGRIRVMDRGSEKLFGLPQGGGLNVHIKDIIPGTVLPRVLETGYASIGRVLDVGGINKISSSYPLLKDGKVVGAIGRILFHSLEEFERANVEIKRLRREVSSLRQREKSEYQAVYTFDNILGISPSIQNCVEIAKKIAVVKADVLITGDSGTGKELFAQAIHHFSGPDKPFVRVNCPAIPFELAESELFGYEKGAFSGANSAGKKGKFEAANNGTIFLDEINSLPMSIQAKLLHVFQEREIQKVSSTKTKKLNLRIIAATNVNLKKAIASGTFRDDLYYRVARTAIHVPPLKERKEDIPILADHFLGTINKRFGTHFKRITSDAKAAIHQHDWPGNVRDLINVLDQACIKQWTGDEIPLTALPDAIISNYTHASPSSQKRGIRKELDKQEMSLIYQSLKETKGNKRKAALRLGMPRSTFYTKLKRYKIS
jgi:transcriptional regulator with PAS, ATPase and Fis domain